MFKRIRIQEPWRQFDPLEIVFHPTLTVLTGANGSGKTTLMNLLNKFYGWSMPVVSTPKSNDLGVLKYFAGVLKWFIGGTEDEKISIGNIDLLSGHVANIFIRKDSGPSYQVPIEPMQGIKGIHIPSHRPVYYYQSVAQIPTRPPSRSQIFDVYSADVKTRTTGGHAARSPSYHMKEALISLAMFGEGNTNVKPNKSAQETFQGFQEILKIVLPRSLGFQKLVVEMPEVVISTDSGEFSLDAVSGGVGSIIDLAWQIYMGSPSDERFVITIDEPENHLHPEMQKSLLPNFIKAFPRAQFIVATHSPLIVSSVLDSNVYVLNYNENRRVISTLLDKVNKAGSSNDILRDALGISTTMPLWAEEIINRIVKKYSSLNFDEKNMSNLRQELKELGLDKVTPSVIAEVSDKSK